MKINEIIRKTDAGYVLYSKSRAGAEKRERQVQYFKHNESKKIKTKYKKEWPFQ
jgi:hypothetical protein